MNEYKYKIDGKEYHVGIEDIIDNVATVSVNDETFKVEMEEKQEPEKKKVVLGTQNTEEKAPDSVPSAKADISNATKSPLPGVITEIKVAVGTQVKQGDTILVLEAMKMANNIEAEADGVVVSICVKEGESVMEDTPLFIIQ